MHLATKIIVVHHHFVDMSRRKLRFDARKRHAVSELLVSVPTTVYCAATAENITTLHARLATASKLPDNWNKSLVNASVSGSSDNYLALYQLQVLPPLLRTAHSFMLTLMSRPEIIVNNVAFLSQNICQDPLENFFGCQRQRGGTSDNPNLKEFYQNTQALRVVDSFCRAPVRGNCRGASKGRSLDVADQAPLPKKKEKVIAVSCLFHINYIIQSVPS